MTYTYKPKGVCSALMTFDIEDNKITKLSVERGCHGNLQGIAKLVEGMEVSDVITRLKGIACGGKPTSCPDQIALGLEKFLAEVA